MVLIVTETAQKARIIKSLTGFETISTEGHVKKVCGLDGDTILYKDSFEGLPLNDVLIATDLTEEGELIAFHICQMMNLTTQPVRLRLFVLTKDAILNAKPYLIDSDAVKSYEEKKRHEIITGSILSAFLYKAVSNTYDKKMVLNWKQLEILRYIASAQKIENVKKRTTRLFSNKKHCFAFTNNNVNDINIDLSCEEHIVAFKWTPPAPSPETKSLYLHGYITHYDSCFEEENDNNIDAYLLEAAIYTSAKLKSIVLKLPPCRPVSLFKETTGLTQSEKRVYTNILRQTILALIQDTDVHCITWSFANSSMTTKRYLSPHVKLLMNDMTDYKIPTAPLELISTETEYFATDDDDDNTTKMNSDEFSILVYRGYIKPCKTALKVFDEEGGKKFHFKPKYILDNLGHIVLKVLEGVDSIDKVPSPNTDISKFEITAENGGKYMVGKYGLVFRTANGDFVKIPESLDIETIFKGGVEMNKKDNNTFGYFKGNRVELKQGKYGIYAAVGNKKNVSLRSIVGNRPIENIKWSEVYNYLLKSPQLF